MTDQSFTTTTTVDRTPDEVFDAIRDPRAWWSSTIEGQAHEVGARFSFDDPGNHLWRFQVTELVRPERIVWHVLDNSTTNFVQDETEWNDTEVRFEIAAKGGQTEIRFTHVGLVPEFECYEACSTGWGHYIRDSLHALLTTGQGRPGAY
jgi:uncharacterized protein YndB with AHSA1/START domain